jgi:2-dehydro-3-deoxyglucarate aldolase/4-hydroxy-2-oxoheptanedioate aldolase
MEKKDAKQLLGTIYSMGAPQVAEMILLSGYDWVMIDMEHSALSLSDTQVALQVFGNKILKIVRVPGNDLIWIKRVLDTGCDGIIVPMINSAEEAARAVSAAKYPLEGQRSVGLSRAHQYGMSFNEYILRANDNLIVMLQIEHADGVKNIDSILKVRGIDAIFIGPYDLSASMGLTGQVNHPEVRSSVELIKKKCRDAGLPYAIFGGSPEVLEKDIKDGCKYPVCGVDVSILSRALNDQKKKLSNIRGTT